MQNKSLFLSALSSASNLFEECEKSGGKKWEEREGLFCLLQKLTNVKNQNSKLA